MVISSLHRTAAEHVTVCFEEGTEVPSTLGVITEMMLFSGKDLDDSQMERLHSLSERALVLEKAISLLSYSRMSAKELRSKLVHKGIHPDTADAVTEKLQDLRLLDDAEYAAAVARHYTAKGYGPGRIRAEFSRRGIERDLWEEALESAPQADEQIDRLVRAKLKDPDDRDQVRKVSAALFRRGFSWDEIRSAIARYSETFED